MRYTEDGDDGDDAFDDDFDKIGDSSVRKFVFLTSSDVYCVYYEFVSCIVMFDSNFIQCEVVLNFEKFLAVYISKT